MRIGEICTTQTIFCTRDETVQGAALLMRTHHVGDLVVIDQPDGERVPVGILTDRDIVVSVIALGLDPASLLVGDIMSDDLLTCSESDDVYETIERMRLRGIRRVPVVNAARRPDRHRQRRRPARIPGRRDGRTGAHRPAPAVAGEARPPLSRRGPARAALLLSDHRRRPAAHSAAGRARRRSTFREIA